jgi:hypothetical protein
VLAGTLEKNVIAGIAEATGGRKGTFRLMRIAALDVPAKRRFVGAYRFADGRLLLVDLGYPEGSDMLYAVDPHTGKVRAMYPASPTEFVSGPALLIPEPTQQTLSFDITKAGGRGVTRRQTGAAPERATRVDIREEEVRFRSGALDLAGTLLTPTTGTHHPGLVFVPSAGQIPREQFWGFGYMLAARGFAVLAFDKRGTGKSPGEWRGTRVRRSAEASHREPLVAFGRHRSVRADQSRRRVLERDQALLLLRTLLRLCSGCEHRCSRFLGDLTLRMESKRTWSGLPLRSRWARAPTSPFACSRTDAIT